MRACLKLAWPPQIPICRENVKKTSRSRDRRFRRRYRVQPAQQRIESRCMKQRFEGATRTAPIDVFERSCALKANEKHHDPIYTTDATLC